MMRSVASFAMIALFFTYMSNRLNDPLPGSTQYHFPEIMP